jgi:hypothetical protein
MKQKPLHNFEIEPDAFISMAKAFIKSYPWKYWSFKEIADEGEKICLKLDTQEKGVNVSKNFELDFVNFAPFWKKYLDIADLEYGEHNISLDLFQNLKPSNHNAIFKTAKKPGLSYSLVVSKVGIKIELLIKTLRQDIKNKSAYNKLVFDEIKKSKDILDKRIKNLVWERLDNRIYSRIYYVIEKCSLNNKVLLPRLTVSKLDGVLAEMAVASDKFYIAFNPVLENLNIERIESKL